MFFASLMLLTCSYGQNQKGADSLISLLEERLTDSVRLKMLYDISVLSSAPEKKIYYSNRLIDEAKSLKDFKYQQLGLLSLGTAYRLIGNLEKSLSNLFESAAIAEKHNYVQFLGRTYAEIATVYGNNGDLRNSLKFNKKSAQLFLSRGDTLFYAYTILNSANQYYKLGELDSSMQYFQTSEAIFNSKGSVSGKAYVTGNRAIVKLALGNVVEAEYDFKKAITMLEPRGDKYGIADFQNELGKVYIETGDVKMAIETITRGLEIAREIDVKAQIRDASELLAELHQEQGNYEEALIYHKQFVAYKDSIQNTETVRKLANQQAEFEIGQAQAQMDAERQTEQVIKYALIFGLGLLMIFGVTQYRNSRQRMATNQVLRDQKAELEVQKSKLEEVNRTKDRFFSIISHDLRGPVNAFHGISRMIKFFVQNKQMDQLEVLAEDIDQSVDRLSSLLDNLLNWAVQQQGQFPYVPEKIEVKALADDLLEVFATMAKSKQISLHSLVAEDLHAWADRNTMMTIIRNLVSNALKFTPRDGEVAISACRTIDSVEIEVRDNGVGIPKEKLGNLFELNEEASTWGTEGEKGLGLGLQLVHEFVELNQGRIEVDSQDGQGTKFTVTLPTYDLNQVQTSVEKS